MVALTTYLMIPRPTGTFLRCILGPLPGSCLWYTSRERSPSLSGNSPLAGSSQQTEIDLYFEDLSATENLMLGIARNLFSHLGWESKWWPWIHKPRSSIGLCVWVGVGVCRGLYWCQSKLCRILIPLRGKQCKYIHTKAEVEEDVGCAASNQNRKTLELHHIWSASYWTAWLNMEH